MTGHILPESTNACPTSPTTDQPELLREAFEAGVRAAESEGFIGMSEAVADQMFTDFVDSRDGDTRLTFTTPTLGDMVMVPREPTPDMVLAAIEANAHVEVFLESDDARAVWSAMIAAAPASPIPISVNGDMVPCAFADCPPGLFRWQGLLCFKSEYSSKPGQQDAYCVDSGEYFWGGTSGDLEKRRALIVTPVAAAAVSPIPTSVQDGDWPTDGTCRVCSAAPVNADRLCASCRDEKPFTLLERLTYSIAAQRAIIDSPQYGTVETEAARQAYAVMLDARRLLSASVNGAGERERIARALYLRRNPPEFPQNADFNWGCAKSAGGSQTAEHYADADAILALSPALDNTAVEREDGDLAERIRAAVTYQYMPMQVRRLLSEAADILSAPVTLNNILAEVASVLPVLWRNIEIGDKSMARENVACLGFLLRERHLPSWDELPSAFDAMYTAEAARAR